MTFRRIQNRITSSTLETDALKDLGAPVQVRRHPSARRMTLRVSRTRRAVVVTIPLRCTISDAGSFVTRNLDWVRQRLTSLPEPVSIKHGAVIPLRGIPHRIVFEVGAERSKEIEIKAQANDYSAIIVPGAAPRAVRQLKVWLAAEAERDLSKSVTKHAITLGRSAKRIAVRDQTSRWGSCSTTGVLSFSWRLVLAPSRVLDYVAAHEVAHLKEMNHGPRFWTEVKRLCPDYEHAKNWLQVYGADLHRYAPADRRGD
jgi:predicted metal-dependent hydrolase